MPAVLPDALIGALANAAKALAAVQVRCRTIAKSPFRWTSNIGRRNEYCAKPRRRPFPIHFCENAACRPRPVSNRDDLQRKFPYLFARSHVLVLPALLSS